MQSTSGKAQQGSAAVIIIIIVVVAIFATLGFLLWRNVIHPQTSTIAAPTITPPAPSTKWLTYKDTAGDLPFVFDYPITWTVTKTKKTYDTYTIVTIGARTSNRDALKANYQIGSTGSDGTEPCIQGSPQLIAVPIQLSQDAAKQKIQVCGSNELWQYSYTDSSYKKIWFSSSNIDVDTFKKVVESIRYK